MIKQVSLLEQNSSEVGACAAQALMEISRANAANQKTVVETGGISQLANLMKTSQHAVVKVRAQPSPPSNTRCP